MIKRRRTGVLCRNAGQILSIKLKDPGTGHDFWSFPGGGIEEGESPETAAVREVLEETGYQVRLTSHAYVNHYPFDWDQQTYQCETHWFTALLTHNHQQSIENEPNIVSVTWQPWPASRHLFKHHWAIEDALKTLIG